MEEVIKTEELELFETVNDRIAAKIGEEIAATEIIMFEDSKLTSELISCEQTAALDLPLKVLVWSENEDTYVGYFDPQNLRRKFLIDGCDETLKNLISLIARIVNKSIRQN